MIDKLDASLRAQGEALVLRARRQQVLASNIANADTPGYKAVDFDFGKALTDALARPGTALARPGTALARPAAAEPRLRLREQPAAQASADGNTVDMDVERAKFADNAVRYEAALRALNGRLRTLLDAIRG